MTRPQDPIWLEKLQPIFNSETFKSLELFVDAEYQEHMCFPPEEKIFAALDSTTLKNVKVVILGQDPYHGFGQAHGLSFSVNLGVKHPPSLVNIFKELVIDCDISYPISGDLQHWADQGVLLLNAVLSVRQSQAGSHSKKGWEFVTDAIIKMISLECENVVFMLWGNYAFAKAKHIDATKHLVLNHGHPSPLSANRGLWFGNKHFSKANEYLDSHHREKINW